MNVPPGPWCFPCDDTSYCYDVGAGVSPDSELSRCEEGMIFSGPSYRTICQADGRWSHPVPRCYGESQCQFFLSQVMS